MGQTAADGAPVADLNVRDVGDRLVQHRKGEAHVGCAFQVPLADAGADAQLAVVELVAGQFGHPADVDQVAGRDKAEGEHRHQALAARDDLGLVPIFGQQRCRLGERFWPVVDQRRRFHCAVIRCGSSVARPAGG